MIYRRDKTRIAESRGYRTSVITSFEATPELPFPRRFAAGKKRAKRKKWKMKKEKKKWKLDG